MNMEDPSWFFSLYSRLLRFIELAQAWNGLVEVGDKIKAVRVRYLKLKQVAVERSATLSDLISYGRQCDVLLQLRI